MNPVNIQCYNGELNVNLRYFSKMGRVFRSFKSSYPGKGTVKIFLSYSFEMMEKVHKFLRNKLSRITSIEEAIELYQFALKHGIPDLKRFCYGSILNTVNVQNIFMVYEFAWETMDCNIVYYCWKRFEDKWKEIFDRREYLNCSETTINTLLSRPIYEKLQEIDLFSVLYNWALNNVNANTTLRGVIEPLLHKIRFLSMGKECFETNICTIANVLTTDEIDSIRNYYSSENQDTSLIHPNINKEERGRDPRFYKTLFSWKNRIPSNIREYIAVNRNTEFTCEISSAEDCFIYKTRLPITHKVKESIKVCMIVRVLDSDKNYKTCLKCNGMGHAELKKCIHVRKYSSILLNANIDDSEIIPENQILINPCTDYFDFPEDKESLFSKYEQRKEEKDTRNFYFEVDLYF
ncbi:uncharacterized protein LOC111620205 [Centruroides sculpturatus]|uniref:uncharacterized protein LOC111620205 n=1 Tax=Centruroides sculpturatus TaxID=218467 RepID=UPI000C6EE753|nr:uncharacterized protein LOC111620205 [Centruroides sculpturatus]